MTMIRRILFLAALLPGVLSAQQSARIAPNLSVTVWYPAPRTLAAFPRWWRDSVRSAIVRAVPGGDTPIASAPAGGGFAWLKLQLLRSGRLYRAGIDRSSGS